jgi:hypothetical protein
MAFAASHLRTLAAALLLAGLCMAAPAWLRFGAAGLEGIVAGLVGCFLPAAVLAAIESRFSGRTRELALVVVGMFLRTAFVLAAGLAVIQLRPALKSSEFFLGLAVFYFVALAVETRQLLHECDASSRPQPQGN